MIYRCEFLDIAGVRYLVGYSLARERGQPEGDDEIEGCPGAVLTEDGRYRLRLVTNPDFGKDGDTRRTMLVEDPSPAPERPAPDPRRAAIAAALPDILLAVADGAELRAAVRKVIEQLEAQHGSER